MTTKKYYGILLPPVITLCLIGFFFMFFGIFPFVNKTVSWCDMNQQTIPLLMDLKDILEGKSSIFYSTGNAGGMNFWGVFLFFIASPFYLLVIFIEKSHLIYFVNILFAVKLTVSSITAAIYFKYSHKKLKTGYVVILSVMYALCGYGIMYYQTLVWLDIMYLFPLLVMSIEKMCTQNKSAMYCAVLSLMVAINYYLSFMIVIYIMISVPLFIYIRCRSNQRKKAAFSFISSSFISLLITAPVWLCSFLQISESARGGNTISGIMYDNMFKNTGNKLSVIMCTALCAAVIPFFIKNKITRKKSVQYNLILLAFMTAPVFLDPINKMWHTGSYQCFPLRYGFIIIFTLLTLSAHYFESIGEYGKTSYGFAVTLIILVLSFFAVSVYTVKTKKNTLTSYVNILHISKDSLKILMTLAVFACLIYIISIITVRQKLLSYKMFCLIISSVFITEFSISASVNIGYAVNDGEIFTCSASLENKTAQEPYYRTKTEKKYLHVNMIGGLGYNSISHYTSLTSEQYMYAMKKLGYSSYWMEVGSNGGTILTDALLSIKYSIGEYFGFNSCQSIIKTDSKLKIAENKICCPIGILSNTAPEKMSDLDFDDRFSVQSELAERLLGSDEMLHKYNSSYIADGTVKYKNGKYIITATEPDKALCQIRYSLNIKENQILYFDVFDRLSNNISENYYESVKVYVNGNCITSSYPSQKNNGILKLGEFNNESVEIIIIMTKDIAVKSFGVFGIETETFKYYTDKLQGCDFYSHGRFITANLNTEHESYLYMAIPYDKGLTAYINGKKTTLYKVNDSFCAVKLQPGKNSIKLSFMPPGMVISLIMLIAGIVTIIVWKLKLSRLSRPRQILCKLSSLFCIICFTGTFIFIYIIPTALRLAVWISDLISK